MTEKKTKKESIWNTNNIVISGITFIIDVTGAKAVFGAVFGTAFIAAVAIPLSKEKEIKDLNSATYIEIITTDLHTNTVNTLGQLPASENSEYGE